MRLIPGMKMKTQMQPDDNSSLCPQFGVFLKKFITFNYFKVKMFNWAFPPTLPERKKKKPNQPRDSYSPSLPAQISHKHSFIHGAQLTLDEYRVFEFSEGGNKEMCSSMGMSQMAGILYWFGPRVYRTP